MKKLVLLILPLTMILLLSACSASSDSTTNIGISKPEISQGANDSAGSSEEKIIQTSDTKIITTNYIQLETLDFEKTTNEIEKITIELKGYIQSSNVSNVSISSNNENSRYANYSLKVPAENCLKLLEILKENSNIVNTSSESIDVSSQYQDTEKRVKALTAREDRLIELLSKANDLSDIIKLEEALSQVIYERETLQGSLNQIDKDVNYTSVNIDVTEVSKYNTKVGVQDSFTDKVITTLKGSINYSLKLFEGMILGLIGLIPIIIVFIPIIIVVYVVVKRLKSSRRNRL